MRKVSRWMGALLAVSATLLAMAVVPADAGLRVAPDVVVSGALSCIPERQTYAIEWTVTNDSSTEVALPEQNQPGGLTADLTITITDAETSGLKSEKVSDLIGKTLAPTEAAKATTFVLSQPGFVELTVDYTIGDSDLTGQAVHRVDVPGQCFPPEEAEPTSTSTTAPAVAPADLVRAVPAFTG